MPRPAAPVYTVNGLPPRARAGGIQVPISDNVAIIGVGVTKFGELFEQSYSDLLIDAAYEAID